MLKIGITGGIGSGKSTACAVFEILGISVFYADVVAKQIMQTDSVLVNDVTSAFGEKSYSDKGELNRKYISDIVFKDDKQLQILNSIVHPAVFRAFDAWSEIHKNEPYILKEAALLFESESYKMCDYNILVKSPEALKIKRIIKRDQISEEEVRLRMDKQLTDRQKEKLSDFILNNNEEELLTIQILKLHEHLISLNPVNA
ncbi:MAG: dephospho-CoA kinase [Daejeonella sp.]